MDIEDSATLIRQIVASVGEITGSKLALELRARAPDWDARKFGSQGLRAFVEQHVSGIEIAGRSGMDLVYKAASALPPLNPQVKQLWTTWVSPFGRYALVLDPATGVVDQLPRSSATPKDLMRLSEPTGDDHLSLAREFLASRSQARPELAQTIDPPQRQWWRPWSAELAKDGQLDNWKAFRQARLEHALRETLATLTDETTAEKSFAQIVATRPASAGGQAPSHHDTEQTQASQWIEAIRQMSPEQLSALHQALTILLKALPHPQR